MKKFYITTAIPYVNGLPHVGHSFEYFIADTIRRYYQLKGYGVLLLSGADENALKNVQAAEKEGLDTQKFLDRNSKIWKDTYEFLGVHLDVFQRGSDKEKHWPGVQKLWELCDQSGDIYNKEYAGLYCVGCESFKTAEELVKSLCPIHQKKPDIVKEKNYFFRLSKYQDKLIQLIESGEFEITPENKRQEALSFIKGGLEDFSISRSNERAQGIGVPVPNDPNQKIYVWFDALNIYMTGVGFGWNENRWKTWWPADLHIIGKDINRFHTVYWPAMLLSARLPIPKHILIHGFVNLKGEKISKSIGNVVSPQDVVNEYGLEPLRYYMLSQIPIDRDGDFSDERFREIYNADLANGLGNLIARIAKLAEKNDFEVTQMTKIFHPLVEEKIEQFKFAEALALIWEDVTALDKKINLVQPWKLQQKGLEEFLSESVVKIRSIALSLKPFLPETAEKILKQFSGNVKSSPSLFPRI